MVILVPFLILIIVISLFLVFSSSKKKNEIIKDFAKNLENKSVEQIKISPIIVPPALPKKVDSEISTQTKIVPQSIQIKGGGSIPPPPPFIWDLVNMPIYKRVPPPPDFILNRHPPKKSK